MSQGRSVSGMTIIKELMVMKGWKEGGGLSCSLPFPFPLDETDSPENKPR